MKCFSPLMLAGAITLAASSAFAADLTEGEASPPPAAPAPSTTIGFEVSPEFYALDSTTAEAGQLADDYFKASISTTFQNVLVLGGSFQGTVKTNDTYQYYGEATLGYKLKFGSAFTLTPSLILGDTWDATGLGADKEANAAYYGATLAGDLKLSPNWTWNMFNVRYRNAFDYKWVTPKATTGVTYAINPNNAVYSNVGYSWKDTGAGLKGDKVNVAFGYKYSF